MTTASTSSNGQLSDLDAARIVVWIARTRRAPDRAETACLGPEWGEAALLASESGDEGLATWARAVKVRYQADPARIDAFRVALDTARAESEPAEGDFADSADSAYCYADGDSPSDSWPPLRLGELPAVEGFPFEVLPDPAARLVEEASGAVGCDPGLVAGPLLAIAGGLIGRSASLLIGSNWFATGCIFQGNVAPPGDGKTHAQNYCKLPLETFERELDEQFQAVKHQYQEEVKAKDKDKHHLRPVPRRLLADDMTMEAAFRVLACNPRGLVMPKGELSSLLLGMDQYKRGKGNDRPNLLKVWDGDGFTIDRVGANEFAEPIRIPHPYLCITGNLPPAMLSAMVNPRGDDGFIDRWLFVYPDRRPKLKPSQRRPVSNGAIEGWTVVARQLWDRPMALDERGRFYPNVVFFTNPGKAEFDRHWDNHVDEVNAVDFPDSMRSTWAKLETYAGRLCLILTLMWRASDPIADPSTLPLAAPDAARNAWKLIDYFKTQ